MDPWTRIEHWLKEHAPDAFAVLEKPATEEQIQSAETVLQVSLPEGMRNFYRRHDGQGNKGGAIAVPWALLSLENMLSEWSLLKELVENGAFRDAEAKAIGPVRADWWNVKWIPFASDGGGSLQCIDLDPAPGGKVGQVVIYLHDHEDRECVAESLQAWLTDLAEDLKDGRVKSRGLG